MESSSLMIPKSKSIGPNQIPVLLNK